MTQYSDEITSAQEALDDAGGAIAFTRSASGYNGVTGQFSQAPVSAATSALQVKANPMTISALAAKGLVLLRPIAWLVAASKLGAFVPAFDDAATWAGTTYTVRDVQPLAPDGAAIMYRVTAEA